MLSARTTILTRLASLVCGLLWKHVPLCGHRVMMVTSCDDDDDGGQLTVHFPPHADDSHYIVSDSRGWTCERHHPDRYADITHSIDAMLILFTLSQP